MALLSRILPAQVEPAGRPEMPKRAHHSKLLRRRCVAASQPPTRTASRPANMMRLNKAAYELPSTASMHCVRSMVCLSAAVAGHLRAVAAVSELAAMPVARIHGLSRDRLPDQQHGRTHYRAC
eukprot:scaffold7004_cov115-Phaeocystis_antarctica.AAC.1